MTRRVQLVLLLESLHDLLPAPETWTGRLQRRNVVGSGPVPSRKVECTVCEGRGRLRSLRPCTTCGGDPLTGKIGRGYRVVDDYTGQEVGTAETEVHAMMTDARCDRCGGYGRLGASASQEPAKDAQRCDRCNGRGTVSRPDSRRLDGMLRRLASGQAGGSDPTLAALERRDQAGSYHELDQALANLRELYPGWWRLVWAVHVAHARSTDDLLPAETQGLDAGLDFLERNLPDPLTVPPWLEAKARAEARRRSLRWGRTNGHAEQRAFRNGEIVRLREQGTPVSEIARLVGLQKSVIYEVLAQRAAHAVATGAMA